MSGSYGRSYTNQNNQQYSKFNDFSRNVEEVIHSTLEHYKNWITQVPLKYKYIHTATIDPNRLDIYRPQIFFHPHLGEELEDEEDTYNIPLLLGCNIRNKNNPQNITLQSARYYMCLPFQSTGTRIATESITKIQRLGIMGIERDQPFEAKITKYNTSEILNTVVYKDQIISSYSNGQVYVTKASEEYYDVPSNPEILQFGGLIPTKAIDIYKNLRVISGQGGTIALFDATSTTSQNILDPVSTSRIRTPASQRNFQNTLTLEDVKISRTLPNMVFGASSTSEIVAWDTRLGLLQLNSEMHEGTINSIDTHPSNEHYLVTGGSDRTVKVWDRRRLRNTYWQSKHHAKVNQVSWSPMLDDALASCSDDGTVNIYTLENNLTSTDSIFTHYGHRTAVKHFQWFPLQEGLLTIASVSEARGEFGTSLQVWETDVPSFSKL